MGGVKKMEKEPHLIECYILGQQNEHGMIEWLVDHIACDRQSLETYLYQTGYICECTDGQCWKYRLKSSNCIDFYIRKLNIPL